MSAELLELTVAEAAARIAAGEVSREEYDVYRRLTIRLLSGHLLLFYLVPLTYFRFIDPRRHLRAPVLDTP